jgi:hypothetical protein
MSNKKPVNTNGGCPIILSRNTNIGKGTNNNISRKNNVDYVVGSQKYETPKDVAVGRNTARIGNNAESPGKCNLLTPPLMMGKESCYQMKGQRSLIIDKAIFISVETKKEDDY